MNDFDTELDDAAGEAVFGLHLNREQAVQFVLNNVSRKDNMTREMAEAAVEKVAVGYKN